MQWDLPPGPGRLGAGDPPTVVLKGLGWRMVALYLQQLGGRLAEGAALEGARGQAQLSGDGWQAVLREQVEFTGALRTRRVEVRLSGRPQAVHEVLRGLRRLHLSERLE